MIGGFERVKAAEVAVGITSLPMSIGPAAMWIRSIEEERRDYLATLVVHHYQFGMSVEEDAEYTPMLRVSPRRPRGSCFSGIRGEKKGSELYEGRLRVDR
ncbi:hypothetical protein DPEC_G00107310 [Dallia pectoralis]|uniref:Uncharacterized protein n=1 Tax=Dallia pectoralis TaxID=75939 RepID=A0ACC2GSA5_DALPE|nr:hypothetical protein DPEC_G00107310 [Dallia pectoralis]